MFDIAVSLTTHPSYAGPDSNPLKEIIADQIRELREAITGNEMQRWRLHCPVGPVVQINAYSIDDAGNAVNPCHEPGDFAQDDMNFDGKTVKAICRALKSVLIEICLQRN